MLTAYEMFYRLFMPFLPALHGIIRKDITSLSLTHQHQSIDILDVGGRKSPHTIGLPFNVTIIDLPRESDIQNQLHLGISSDILLRLQKNRSNIKRIVFEDMGHCTLPDASFDGVLCVEVIEHVQEDAAFVRQIARVLKPGGWAYFTTPNGDHNRNDGPNRNPDHKRHYHRDELCALLQTEFDTVRVDYGVKIEKCYSIGLGNFSVAHPLRTLHIMWCNLISRQKSRHCSEHAHDTAHLLALAQRKR